MGHLKKMICITNYHIKDYTYKKNQTENSDYQQDCKTDCKVGYNISFGLVAVVLHSHITIFFVFSIEGVKIVESRYFLRIDIYKGHLLGSYFHYSHAD